jgi:nitric oxide reductase NorD protein
MALQQAMRAQRGSAALANTPLSSVEHALYVLIEAASSDAALVRILPGLALCIDELRRACLAERPALQTLAPAYRPLELLTQSILQSSCGRLPAPLHYCATAQEALELARDLAGELYPVGRPLPRSGAIALLKDYWTGDFVLPQARALPRDVNEAHAPDDNTRPPRSAVLPRRPQVREAPKDEDDEQDGVWMVQTNQPSEHVEDPMGMQRPTDRDEQTPADEFADSLSELPEARLVSSPGSAKEVLLSDDPPDGHTDTSPQPVPQAAKRVSYPEWDYRLQAYRDPGTTVHLRDAELGPSAWADQTLEQHRPVLELIRRRFEMLRPERLRLRKQFDGEEIDLDAYIDARCDVHAGLPLPQALYKTQRRAQRNMAIMLLVDVSGSTDSLLSARKRIIDVEREALLLVCIALEGLGAPYSVQTFSGEGRHGVSISSVKCFAEHYGEPVARRIAALEPERYTRAGAAIRHASALLMDQAAEHRLLLLLSDGKPNDADDYEGRYGIEDMRQAVTEARLQGLYPFCLTIDRQAASYLPIVFGRHQYALLTRPEHLPTVLLDWMRRLLRQT